MFFTFVVKKRIIQVMIMHKNGNPHFIQQYSVELSLQGRVILDGINWIMQVSGW